jgi:hypothetical protein
MWSCKQKPVGLLRVAEAPTHSTNKRLLDPWLDKDAKLAEQPLERWATLHAVRTVLSLASVLAFLFATHRR